MYAQTLPAEHQLVGIARVRLGRAILRQRRYSEAENESRAGYELLMKQTNRRRTGSTRRAQISKKNTMH